MVGGKLLDLPFPFCFETLAECFLPECPICLLFVGGRPHLAAGVAELTWLIWARR